MIWLLKFLTTWLSIDVVVIATNWYANTVIRVYFPNWWKRVICDDQPDTRPELKPVAQPVQTIPSKEFH